MTPCDQSDSGDDRLPGEIDGETQKIAVETWALTVFTEGMRESPDEYLASVLAVCHEEWERRHDERWVIAE